MRILHFLPVYAPAWQYGGPILSVSRLCEGLVANGLDVRVITTNAGLTEVPDYESSINAKLNGVCVSYYPVDRHKSYISSITLQKSLSQHMQWADILHLSSIWQPLGLHVQKMAHHYDVPVIQTLRGALGPYSWSRGWLKKFAYYHLKEKAYLQKTAAIHCTTHQEATEISSLHLRPPIEVIPNPLDLSHFYCDPSSGGEWRRQNGFPHDIPIFAVVGRLHHKKGLDLLPQVLSCIQDKAWQLVVIGHDEDGTGASLRRSLAKLKLVHRTRFFPSMSSYDLLGPLNASNWLLLPSRHENFGNIAIEALACGCGVLLSDRVGVSQMLSDCPGVLVGPRDYLKWRLLVEYALSTPRPSTRSESWVKEAFSCDLVAKQATELYKRLI